MKVAILETKPISKIVELFKRGLEKQGHETSILACNNLSQYEDQYKQILDLAKAYKIEEFDIIHDHSGTVIGAAMGALVKIPVLHTIHGITKDTKQLYKDLSSYIHFNATSKYQKRFFGDLNWVNAIIYNAIDVEAYNFTEKKDGYLAFLDNMNPQTRPDTVIEVANRLQVKLKLVTGEMNESEKDFFNKQIKPIMSGYCELIEEADPKIRAEICGNAHCTVSPGPNLLGSSLIESLVCGTPVVSIKDGIAPEIIYNEVTGYIVNQDIDDMCEAVKKIDKINPIACRVYACNNFCVATMVQKYQEAYATICNQAMLENEPFLERRRTDKFIQ